MEILKTEDRLEVGRERHERKKRQYRKQAIIGLVELFKKKEREDRK